MPRVTVRILDVSGEAMPGAHVSVPWASHAYPEFAYVADGEGAVILDLAAGEYHLHADTLERLSGRAEVAVGDADIAIELRVK